MGPCRRDIDSLACLSQAPAIYGAWIGCTGETAEQRRNMAGMSAALTVLVVLPALASCWLSKSRRACVRGGSHHVCDRRVRLGRAAAQWDAKL